MLSPIILLLYIVRGVALRERDLHLHVALRSSISGCGAVDKPADLVFVRIFVFLCFGFVLALRNK